MGAGKISKFSAIFLASVLLFSTVSISSLAGMTPLPNAYAGGGGGGESIIGFTCNANLILAGNEGSDSALTFRASEGVFYWATFDELYRLTVDGVKTFIGDMDHDTRGLAFSLDGNTLYSIEQRSDQLRIVDPADASAAGSSTTITLEGKFVNGGGGLATHPTTGVLFALLRIEGEGRVLVTLDPSTGVATSIGNTGLKTAGIAFNSGGTLFAMSAAGSGAGPSIFTVSTSNGSLTFVCSNASNGNGSSIAFNPNDGALYFSINDSRFFKFNGGILNPTQCETQNISNNTPDTKTAMTFFESAGVFLYTGFNSLRDLTPDGVASFIGSLGGFTNTASKGLAFSLDGNTLYSLSAFDNHLHIVDPANASTDSGTVITLTGPTVTRGTALAIHPTTGELWAVVITGGGSAPRELVTINPSTGDATSIGSVGLIAGLAFDSSGTLFAVTGEAAVPSETLVTLSQTDATQSIVCALGNGGGGEAFAFNPNDGSFYHMSGSIFEKIVGFDALPLPNVQRLALFSIDRFAPFIYEIDPVSGAVISAVPLKSDFAVTGGTALTTDSVNTMFAVLSSKDNASGDDVRTLAKINPGSGEVNSIGVLGDEINAIAFKDGILYGVTGRNNPGPANTNALVTIDTATAEVTALCQFPGSTFSETSRPVIGFNERDDLLHYFVNHNLSGPILDIPSCTIGTPGETMGYDFEYFIYSLISMILPKAEAGGAPTVNIKGVTWDDQQELFLACGSDFGTVDPDTGTEVEFNNNLGHTCKGLAFIPVAGGGGSGAGAVGQAGAPTIGVDSDGRQIVPCGVAFDGQCFTISAPFHEEFKLFEMMSGTHTISITMWCPKGVSDCAYAAIGVMPYSASMDNPTWKIEAYKDFEGNITIVKTDPEGFLGEVTVTNQIEGTFWVTSFTIEFKNIDTGPMMFGVQARTQNGNVWNWYLNEGVEFKDSDAYPSIVTIYDDLLEIDSLCLNEDPTNRYSCAFEKIRERAIQVAEETLRQIMNN